MNLSKDTLILIKNFSNINGSLLLQPGHKISTISEGRNIMAEATVPEEFPLTFGIYDLGEFLNAVSLFNNPQIEFTDHYATISDSVSSKIKYYGAGEGIVKAPPPTIKFPVPEISFTLDSAQLAMIIKTASVLKTTDISIAGNADSGELTALVKDKKNATANAYNLSLSGNIGKCDTTFTANFRLDNLKSLLPGTYNVDISSKKISKFSNPLLFLTYFIAIEADSEFTV